MTKAKVKIKHIIVPPIIYSAIFFTLYFRMQGVSGGDILVGAMSGIFLVVMTLIIGAVTFSWKMKGKLGYVLGIFISFLIAMLYHSVLL